MKLRRGEGKLIALIRKANPCKNAGRKKTIGQMMEEYRAPRDEAGFRRIMADIRKRQRGKKKNPTQNPKKSAWQRFLKGRMGPAMKKYRSHGAAMKHLAAQWRKRR